MLRLPLIKGASKSRILVTTRSEKVATTMNATYIHELKGLSDGHSWKLFRSRAFAGRKVEEYPELESVGRAIVKKCKGVPLSIKVIGSAMHSKRTVGDWKNVLDSRIWSLPQVTDKILPALVLTYSYLPTHLKQCFAYCSIFSKDSVLERDLLVRLWVAQGFIRSEGNREIEDIGVEYFDELMVRSLFQEVEKNYDGEIVCKMHDLVHDLAEFIVSDEIYTSIFSSDGEKSSQCPSINGNVRHAYLSFPETLVNIPISFGREKKLHSFILKADGTKNVIFDLFHQARFLRALHFRCSTTLPKSIFKMKHLRYLNIGDSEIVELPKAIGKMKQLMYLDLSSTKIVVLPESVIHLHNLHTLNLNECSELKKLPRGMDRMVGLRHLEIKDTYSLECLPRGLCKITSLRTLRKFIVGGEGGCGIDELQLLNSLQGSLEIESLDRVSSREEAEGAQLWNKSHLRSLALSMPETNGEAEKARMESVFEGLQPHGNLEELQLDGYPSSKLPSWMEVFPCLHKLVLSQCSKLEWFPRHFANASLTMLRIESCDGIKGIESSSSLPLLEELILIDSSEFLSSGLPDVPNLRTLKIEDDGSERLPDGGWERLPALQRLKIWNCEGLKCLPDGLAQLQLLQQLLIGYNNQFESLLEALGQLKKLKWLHICSLGALTCLPDSIGQLESLQHLEIMDCEALGSLPHGLQNLLLLKVLQIEHCLQLSERCKPEEGVDWPNISHIRYISINGERTRGRNQR